MEATATSIYDIPVTTIEGTPTTLAVSRQRRSS